MYNTNLGNFNKYHLETLIDSELIEYANLLVIDAAQKENEMNINDTYNNSYNFSDAAQKVSQINQHMNKRGMVSSDFKFGIDNLEMYNCNNIEKLLELF